MTAARTKRRKVRLTKPELRVRTPVKRRAKNQKTKTGMLHERARPVQVVQAISRFDFILKNGRVIDPARGIDGTMDLAIKDGKIAALETRIGPDYGRKVRDVSGLLVLPGLIDTHGHIFEYVSGDFGLNADDVGVRSGVTTVCDQGGPSALTINGFRKFVVEASQTKVKCFISAYLAGGLHGHRYVQLYGPSGVNVDATVKAAQANRDIVRGIKVHAEVGGYTRWRLEVTKLAKEISRRLELPIYIHLGRMWPNIDENEVDPSVVVDELVPLLDKGDIIAHPFTHRPAGFVSAKGEVHPLIFKALERGVKLDVGHGSHFSFSAAQVVVKAGIIPYTLGSDLHGSNTGKIRTNKELSYGPDGAFSYTPTFSLYTAMSEMLTLGIPEAHVLKMVTSNAAAMLGMSDEIGTLGPGRVADVSVVEIKKGRFELSDNSGVTVKTDRLFRPVFALRAGTIADLTSPLLPKSERIAA